MTLSVERNQNSLAQEDYGSVLRQEHNQYSLKQVIGIWLATGAPMWALGWLAYPALSHHLSALDAGLLRMKLLTLGLVWQFVLSLIIVYWEERNLRISTIRQRFWLNGPRSPRTGRRNNQLWWLLVPLILLVAALDLFVMPALSGLWTKFLPFLAEPAGYSMGAMFAPELRARWIGAWNLLAIEVVLAIFNTFLGEEFLFRGVLLPKMNGVFGRWDWVANGILFGLYHLHQPWDLPGNVLSGLLLAFPGKQFRSNWFPIILHSAESIYFIVLLVGLILGLAQ